MLKLYNNNNDDCDRKILIKKLIGVLMNKQNDQTDIHTDRQTKTDRQIHVHPSTYIVVHKHQRKL